MDLFGKRIKEIHPRDAPNNPINWTWQRRRIISPSKGWGDWEDCEFLKLALGYDVQDTMQARFWVESSEEWCMHITIKVGDLVAEWADVIEKKINEGAW